MPQLLLFFPLLCVFALNVPRRRAGARLAPWALAAVCAVQAGYAASFAWQGWRGVDGLLRLPAGFALTVDPLGALALFTIALVAAAALPVLGAGADRLNFASLTLMLLMGMNGVVLVRDLFTLYIFLEITAVASYILIAMERGVEALEGAFKYLMMSALATVMMLSANALVFIQTGSLAYGAVAGGLAGEAGLTVKLAMALYVAGFSIKAGVVPFHGWLPGAYTAAPNAVSVLLAGIVTKIAGVYVVLRMMADVFGAVAAAGQAFMALGALSIVVGAVAAIGQGNMKRMLAWSSVSQVGYIILAAGLGTKLALVGAALHFFNHAVFKSLLFVDAAAVEERAGTVEMENLGGVAERMPVTGWTSVLGFLSTAGIPPLAGFWSKLVIILALCTAGQWVYGGLALLMSLVTLAYFLVMQRKVFFGRLREGLEGLRECRAGLRAPELLLAAVTVLAGVLFPLALLFLRSQGLV